jgi:hypothetical protein
MDQICTFARQNTTCSKECSTKLGNIGREKVASKLTRKCKYCGKEFTPTSSRDFYCKNKHYATCEVCGKQFEIVGRIDIANKTCSKECRYKLAKRNTDMSTMIQHQKATMLEKYGVENSAQIPGTSEKAKATTRAKYGVDHYTQTEEYKNNVKQTSIEKYGVEHYLMSEDVKAKRIQTVRDKYGVDNVFQSATVKEKSKQTVLSQYGVTNVSKSEKVIRKVKDTNLSRYGVEHAMMLPKYQEKAKQTNFAKFGLAAPTQSHIKNIENWYKFINDPREYIQINYSDTPRTEELAVDLGVDRSTIDDYLNRFGATDCVRRATSLMEEEIVEFISQLSPEIKIIRNVHKILGGKELDIYLPDYNFAIECNPTATHNSSIPDPWGGSKKSINYHKHKTDKCADQGIFLMHIFGYEWTHSKDILKSMIANNLGHSNKIYARKCHIGDVSPEVARVFLQQNHRQGFASSKVYLGLYYADELVAIMTFGKIRGTMGTDSSDLSDCWELVRFCNKLNTTVVGGASRLFNYFITTYNPSRIRSFSDRAHTKGGLYKTLGFNPIRQSGANYVWVNIIDDKAYHRVNAQKKNLKKFLKDDTIDLSLTEKQIMESHGYVQVFDSGTITWEWVNQNNL